MSLDQNLFTLNITPSASDPSVVDLVDPAGTIHYHKERVNDPNSVYTINIYDPITESLLVTATAPSATSKHKTLQLHNPSLIVELKYTGTLSFKWSFQWEGHEFEWKREECYILRKPDPSVLVAVTKEPPGRLRTSSVQLLDYNLNRFDIDDRKGLEIVILTALLTFQDTNEAYHASRAEQATATSPLTSFLGRGIGRQSSDSNQQVQAAPADAPPMYRAVSDVPLVPPRPPPRTGVERIAEMHMIRSVSGDGEANEVEVGEEGAVEDYAQYVESLLKDEAMLFVSVRSASAAQVPKVLRVVEETKRLRHKAGIAEDEELHQYVVYDTSSQTKGPRRINLNDPKDKGNANSYAPPTSLTVHLSKIDMPELQPKGNVGAETTRFPSISPPGKDKASAKDRQQAEKAEKEERKAEKKADKKADNKGSLSNKLSQSPTRTPHYHTPAHLVHPHQPSPSPSQLNNPMIYTAPPPPRRAPPSQLAPPDWNTRAASYHSPAPGVYGSTGQVPYGMPDPVSYLPSTGGNPPGYAAPVPTNDSGRGRIAQATTTGKGIVTGLLEQWSKH